jgi:non-specific serine/threonine protein kinase
MLYFIHIVVNGRWPLIEVRLLGAFSVKSGRKAVTLTSRPAQSLFAYLILNAGTAFRREKLAGMLWPDSTEEAARDYLRHALWRIRKALQEAAAASHLEADDLTIGFNAAADIMLDTATVKGAAGAADVEALKQALSAYGGELLPGFYEDWVVLEREHLRAVFEREMERLLGLLQNSGRWPEVLEWAEKWIAFGQKPEPAYRALMLAHAANGDMSKVAATYERCVSTLKDFGVAPSEQTRALFDEIKSGKRPIATTPAAATPLPAQKALAPSSNIPVPLTSFIGRERELEKIAGLLAASRLVTLTGPGGVGKTRLAVEAANAALKQFPDGVFWVGLASVSDEKLISHEIAQALGVREAMGEPIMSTLIRHLQGKETLLVLDNCEHLIAGCAQKAEQLLAACLRLRILATSIEGLGLFNETVLQVPSLPLPAAGPAGESLKDFQKYESVRLFSERAGTAGAAFSVNEANAADVAQICKRLDGIPLAIELAAARTKVLSVEEIAARLDDRFSLLTAGSRTAIPRHQTLRATIDWSHDLLSEPERTLFRRLSVFAGGFTLKAAEVVCGAGMRPGEVLDQLGRLTARSLATVEPAEAGETRYRLLETIRQYALEKLLAAGEASAVRQSHVDYYLQMAEESEPFIFGSGSALVFGRLERELDNLRVATEWASASGGAIEALRILGAIVYFWFARGLPGSEWEERIQHALSLPEGRVASLARAKALNGIGFMSWAETFSVERRAENEEALAIGRALQDSVTIGKALRNLGLLELVRENLLASRQALNASLEIWTSLGDAGRLERANTLSFLGDVAMSEGQVGEAGEFHAQAVLELAAHGDMNFQAYSVRRLGQLAWHGGDYEKGFELCDQSLKLNFQVSDPRGICACLAGFAAIAAGRGQYERAATIAGAVERMLQEVGIRLLLLDLREFNDTMEILRAHLSESKIEQYETRGRSMPLEKALEFATGGGR